MNNLLEKLRKIDKRILGGVGFGGILVVALIIGWIIVGNDTPANDIDKENGAEVNQELETENQNSDNQAEQEDEIKSEDQAQDSDTPNGSENSDSELSDDSNKNNEQSDKDSESKAEEKPSTSGQKPSNEQKPSEDNEKDESNKSENSDNNSNDDAKEDSKEDLEETPATETYKVNVYSTGGHKLYNVKINVYEDNTMANLVKTASTNSSGIATLELVPSNKYVFSLSNIAEGYQIQKSYKFSGKAALVVLKSSVITGKDIPTTKLKVGDVMYDFSVTSAKDQTITLSKLLKTKKMVMLNFWYVNCYFCVKEFPAMSSAYSKYSEDIEIIALNPFDNMDAVKEFLITNPLEFQVATCSNTLPNAFGVEAYPVSIIIDQYGVIREIENGAILEEQGFIDLFNKYS